MRARRATWGAGRARWANESSACCSGVVNTNGTFGRPIIGTSYVRGTTGATNLFTKLQRQELEPVDGGRRTRVTGVAVADPRGSIPTWVVNLYQRNWPYDTIMAMRGQAKKSGLTVLPRLRALYTALRKRIE